MNNFKDWVEQFILEFKDTILQYYSKSHSYFADLIISKGVPLASQIDNKLKEENEKKVLLMIKAINSGLITIGMSPKLLENANQIYDTYLNINYDNYQTFLELFNQPLKRYINKHLFNILIEFLASIDKKKMENLDLFDLIPNGFIKKLYTYKTKNPIPEDYGNLARLFIEKSSDLFDPTNLLFLVTDINFKTLQDNLDESNLLKRLKQAKEENIGVLTNKVLDSNAPGITSNAESLETNQHYNLQELSLENYFFNFPAIPNRLALKFKVNFVSLDEVIKKKPDYFDLENLFYAICIYKMFGRDFPISVDSIQTISNNFINGRIFSTGKYHIPNPVSIFYGIALFSQLNILQNSNLIDVLDIEMSLENDLSNFNPLNTQLNFFNLMSLKLLQLSGEIIKSKKHLLESLTSIGIEEIENFKSYNDLFFYISSTKSLGYDFKLNGKRNKYITLLNQSISDNGSVNNSLTDTARTLLSLRMLDSKINERERLIASINYFLNHLSFFDEKLNPKFNWQDNQLAFKVELRMLFWAALALI